MVTDFLSNNGQTEGSSGNSCLPSFRYSQKFEEMCPYYMLLGMSYEEYWDGDNLLPRYYKKMEELRKERVNSELWLQGLYIYEALLDSAPVLNALSAKKKPIPYRDTPIPVTESESKRAEEAAKAKKIKITKDAIYAMMASVNKQFEKGGNDDGN